MTNDNRQQKKVVKKRSSSLIPPHLAEEKQDNAIIEDWLAERLTDKLRKASIVVQQTHRPHLLYRNTIEESQDVLQEEVGIRKTHSYYDLCIWRICSIYFSENRGIYFRQIY